MSLPLNWFGRYVWRRDVARKVAERARLAHRRLRRDDLADIRALFAHRSPRLVFDVGANVGYETDRFLRAFPDAVVHAFEPTAHSFDRLRAHFEDHPRVVLHRVAVAATTGRATFRVDNRVHAGGSNSLLAHAPRFMRSQATADYAATEVPTVRLDDVAREAGIDHVDLLKLDIEGAEVLALEGAKRLLESQAIDVVDAEVRALPDYEGQPLLEDLLRHLRDHDYRLLNLYGQAEADSGQLLWANAVLLSDRFRAEVSEQHGWDWTRF